MQLPIELSDVRCGRFGGINEVRIEGQEGRGIRVALSQLSPAPKGAEGLEIRGRKGRRAEQ